MTAKIICQMQAARILLFVYMFYHVYLHYDQVICKSMKIELPGLWIVEYKSFHVLKADKNFLTLIENKISKIRNIVFINPLLREKKKKIQFQIAIQITKFLQIFNMANREWHFLVYYERSSILISYSFIIPFNFRFSICVHNLHMKF